MCTNRSLGLPHRPPDQVFAPFGLGFAPRGAAGNRRTRVTRQPPRPPELPPGPESACTARVRGQDRHGPARPPLPRSPAASAAPRWVSRWPHEHRPSRGTVAASFPRSRVCHMGRRRDGRPADPGIPATSGGVASFSHPARWVAGIHSHQEGRAGPSQPLRADFFGAPHAEMGATASTSPLNGPAPARCRIYPFSPGGRAPAPPPRNVVVDRG